MIRLDHPSILIFVCDKSLNNITKTIFTSIEGLKIQKIIILYDNSLKNNELFQERIHATINHYQTVAIDVIAVSTNVYNITNEYLNLAEIICSNFQKDNQLIIDCNEGPRYIRPILTDSIAVIRVILKLYFEVNLSYFEILKFEGRKEYYKHQFVELGIQGSRILLELIPDLTENELGELLGIKQSTVSSHLKKLKQHGYIEGTGKKSRRLTLKGETIANIVREVRKRDKRDQT